MTSRERRITTLGIAAAASAAGVMVLCNLLGESFTERLPGEVLLPGFLSYATRTDVLASLDRDVALRVIEDSPPVADGRPPFAIHTVEAQPMSCFGQRGVMRLSFFNDRLLEVCFYVDEPDALFGALREQGLALDGGGELERGCVRITAGKDAAGRRFVAWRDVRLVRQQDRWLSRRS
ncbi:MAG: hypothetical protein MUC36_03710 [Planctomycetes bacterium]|jgi:hypothetical protein|nr:hypothetical protein [Planctomycetota bacterium]